MARGVTLAVGDTLIRIVPPFVTCLPPFGIGVTLAVTNGVGDNLDDTSPVTNLSPMSPMKLTPIKTRAPNAPIDTAISSLLNSIIFWSRKWPYPQLPFGYSRL